MILSLPKDPAPVRIDEDGVARVGSGRVPIDTVIHSFNQGSTPEEIAQRYPSLALADIYGVIALYLNHRAEVEAYLDVRRENAARVRHENEARHDPQGIRDRLLARLK
jgi:uncharacterized protein (DUF433 family)